MGAEAWVPSLQGGEGGEEKRWVGWQRQWLNTGTCSIPTFRCFKLRTVGICPFFLHFTNQNINHK